MRERQREKEIRDNILYHYIDGNILHLELRNDVLRILSTNPPPPLPLDLGSTATQRPRSANTGQTRQCSAALPLTIVTTHGSILFMNKRTSKKRGD